MRAYDPVVSSVPAGADPATDEADAARDADLVLSVNSGQDAAEALRHGLPGLRAGAVWADLNTSAAELKEQLAAIRHEGERFCRCRPHVARSRPGAPYADARIRAGC